MVEFDKEKQKLHKKTSHAPMGMSDFYDEVEHQIACFHPVDILVIGSGSGLELERIKHHANVSVANISPEKLREINHNSLSRISVHNICSSIVDYNFGTEAYDLVLSCYTMHHFNKLQKLEIYQNVYAALKPNGIFINGDTMAVSLEESGMRMQEAEEIYAQESLPFGSLHIDVPTTYEQEVRLLDRAGFSSVSLEREWSRTKLYKAIK